MDRQVLDEAIGVREIERPQQPGIDDAEHGDGGGNGHGQGGHDDGSKPFIPAQKPDAMSQVTRKIIEN